jgi:predicted nucleotidyltransferase
VPAGDLAATLTSVLKDQPGLTFAVLYGSHAAGRATPVSDIDVAVYVGEAGDFLATAGALDEAMTQATGSGPLGRFPGTRVDVVDLREQPAPVYYEILASGQLLFTTDDAFFKEEKLRVMREYLDFRPTYERVLEAMDQRLENGTYGKPS